jgi:nanoRNase/pAp phosphatase (c-di-AMP/oligoRNAs hydrolase)
MREEYNNMINTIKRSREPLVVIPAGGGADSFASALGIARLIRKLEKPVHIVTADKESMAHLNFLDEEASRGISQKLENLRTYVVQLDVSKTKPDELSYDVIDGKLHIYLRPSSGVWTEKDLKLDASAYKHDLIICVGAKNLEACARVFEDHPDFFYRTPIINIDNAPHNEHFGHVNLVDLTASAIGEVCHDWVESVAPELIDAEMATQFLTGMIAKTKSFRAKNVTPKTLQVASTLMARGANRDKIVHHLYRTRTIETLRLWGRALARLKVDAERGIVWSLLSQQDFMNAGTDEIALSGVIEELISSSPSTKIAVIIYEDKERQISAIVHTSHPHDAIVLCMPFKPAGTHEEARLYFPGKSLVEVERALIEYLKRAKTS